jgi:hypothetical protein
VKTRDGFPTKEENVDSTRFDRISRVIGDQKNRRDMLKTAVGSALAIAGLGAVSQTVLGVTADANKGYRGDDCRNNPGICKQGLVCNAKEKCEYKSNCGGQKRGKKNDACKNTNDCCRRSNLQCRSHKCRRRRS